MTKRLAELIARVKIHSQGLHNELCMELESNVCIPKGENRHKWVDELHAMAEGIKVETREYELLSWYVPSKIMSPFTHPSNEWRIKPSEPIYEYKMLLFQLTGDYILSDWMTIDEFNSSTLNGNILHDTKRIRQ